MRTVACLRAILVIAVVAGCASTHPRSVVLHASDNGPAGLPPSPATATFVLPSGWAGLPGDAESRGTGRFSLCPKSLSDVSGRPWIEVFFGYLDPTVPYTQEGQARGYLNGIHHHSDDKVQLAGVGVIQHPQFGPINLYRYSSDNWGERLYGEITAAPLGFSAELHCRGASALTEYRPALEAVLRSVQLHGIQPSHEDDPRRLQRGW
ncbi:MAG: hypothetical protein WCE61_22425 [Candidatus Acidiferrum sp.]